MSRPLQQMDCQEVWHKMYLEWCCFDQHRYAVWSPGVCSCQDKAERNHITTNFSACFDIPYLFCPFPVVPNGSPPPPPSPRAMSKYPSRNRSCPPLWLERGCCTRSNSLSELGSATFGLPAKNANKFNYLLSTSCHNYHEAQSDSLWLTVNSDTLL